MLKTTGTLPGVVKLCTKIGDINFFRRPYSLRWNTELGQFANHKQRVNYPLYGMISVFFLQSLNFLVNQGSMKVIQKALFCRVLLPYVVFSTATLWIQHKHGEAFAQILNQILALEKKWLKMEDSKFWKDEAATSGKTVRKLLSVAEYFRKFSIGMGTMSAAMSPHLPFNPVSIFTPIWIHSEITFIAYFGRLVAGILGGLFWYTSAHALFFGYLLVFIVPLFGVRCLLDVFRSRIRTLDRRSSTRLSQLLTTYKEIQLVLSEYNSVHKLFFVGTQTVTLMLANISTAFALVTQLENMTPSAFGSVLEGFIASFLLIMVGMRFAANVNTESRKALGETKYAFTKPKKDKLDCVRCTWKACPQLKVQFFSCNYFERLTPVRIMEICLSVTLNLVLIK
ncbi:unnamed protein product [Orchesella dallaii]|uniref:Odorant receptor n=1 Tax=Orchesella dallaii TaxID=48710 RepID=A0ABP1RH83_9HEXA